MARYLRVTGKILSRDSYWEERWNTEKEKYEQYCVYMMRVEYTVAGKIYTHNFVGEDIKGDIGEEYELLCLKDDPQIIKTIDKRRKTKNPRISFVITEVILLLIVVLLYMVCFNRCSILHVPGGHYSTEEHSKLIGFQDSTDFAIYRYLSVQNVENDPDYQKMSEEDARKVSGYFEHFRDMVESENQQQKYSQAESSISAGDYCRIDTLEGQTSGDFSYGEYDDYSVWFFDTDTMTLYFIHFDV